jgi:hypothetical protein
MEDTDIMKHLPSTYFMSHTFVSYNHHDYNAAVALTHHLQELGLRAWLDRDSGEHDQAPRSSPDIRGTKINGDDEYIESLLGAAIIQSIITTVITSPHTLQSSWVRKEIEIACRLQKPLFFWHVVEPEEVNLLSMRTTGTPHPDGSWYKLLKTMKEHYKKRNLASSASIEFIKGFAARRELNTIGHKITTVSEVLSVCNELNTIIELGELILHNSEVINADSCQKFWPEYNKLCEEAEKLEQAIFDRFGKRVTARRTPVAHAFRLKRPHVISRIRHLERLLNDQNFREKEFLNFGN